LAQVAHGSAPKISSGTLSFVGNSKKRFVFNGFIACRQLALRKLKVSGRRKNLTNKSKYETDTM
jgi:hypothetical protein